MRTVLLAVCVTAAVLAGFAMRDRVPYWTVPLCALVFVACFLLGRRTPDRWPALVVCAAGAAVGVVDTAVLVTVVVSAALPWFLGHSAHQQAALAASVVEAAHLRERTRIAHEVHDTLGHELSLLALQAGALEMTLPAEHREAAARIRVSAGTATDRLADLVFLLRDGDPPPVARVQDLVDRAVRAGLDVDFVGDESIVDRNVHRVVQEALTNAAKHAPRSVLRLRVSRVDGMTVVEASNPLERRGRGGRVGLVALRERVRLAGGTLQVSRGDGRFTLVARLPGEL